MGIDIMFIMGIILVIAACLLLFKLMESVSQAILMFNVALLVLLLIVGVALFVDFKSFTDSFPAKEKIVLIEKDNATLSAALLLKGNSTEVLNPVIYAAAFEKSNYADAIRKNQIILLVSPVLAEEMKGDYRQLPNMLSDNMRMIAEYKKGNIKAYPEPFSFKIARFIPDRILKIW